MIESELNFKTPRLQQWTDPVFVGKGLQVAVLRLDEMHPVLGGNKWMKMRLFLQQALQQKKAGILTKGGPWSNHLYTCGWACQQLALPLQVWVKGHEKLRADLLDDLRQWDAAVRFVNRNLFYDEVVAQDFAMANNLLYVPMGGAEESSVSDSSLFLQELQLPRFNYAACAVGTATTFGGLAFVPHNFTTVIGIDAGTNDKEVANKVIDWQKRLPQKKLVLHQNFSFGGFARRTPELIAFANEIYRDQGIPTDAVYTAKLFYAIRQLAQQDYFERNSSVMILHSGGLQGNRSLPSGTLQF